MSGEIEAAGALTTAGLVAGAIEGRPPGEVGEGACPNCGAQLTGRFCAQCGQAAHAHRTLAHVLEEFLHGVLYFDTKVWRTLPMLIARPGTLTRNYVYGKRARYISPLAMFLFTIFLLFFVFETVDVDIFHVNATPRDRGEIARELTELRRELNEAEANIAAERAQRTVEPTPTQRAADAQRENALALTREAVRQLETQMARAEAAVNVEATQGAPSMAARQSAQDAAAAAPVEQTWQEELSEAARTGNISVGTGLPALDARIVHSLQNPDLALYKTQQAASAFAFLLVPISLPFIWLLFIWKRGLTLYDHIAFTLYALSFASVVFVFVGLSSKAPGLEWMGAAAMGIGVPAHMFFHLKGAYALGWWSATWRTLFLLLFAILSLAIFFVAIILLGLGG